MDEGARQIAARARRLLFDEEADWIDYCVPGCPLCAIELAREQVDEEHGYAAIDEARAIGDDATRLARQWVDGAKVHQRACG